MKRIDVQQALLPLWRERTLRERAVLAVLAALLLALMGYGVLWQPAADNSARLQRELPQMRSELARMQAMAAELAASKRSTPVAVPVGADLQAALQQSLQEMGLSGQKLATRPDGRITLEWHDAPFSRMADWLDQARQKWRVRVVEGHVERTLHPGDVNARLVLRGGD
jgi:general secretion pathway protein M